MDNENIIPEKTSEDELLEREDRCCKAIKTLRKAIFMRLFVTAILIWAVIQTDLELWVIGLMALVLIINLSGLLPLVKEWKNRCRERKEIIAQFE